MTLEIKTINIYKSNIILHTLVIINNICYSMYGCMILKKRGVIKCLHYIRI